MSNEKDIDFITSIFKDEHNGITFCSGSLAVNKQNNLEKWTYFTLNQQKMFKTFHKLQAERKTDKRQTCIDSK